MLRPLLESGQYVSLAFGQAARDAGIAVSMGSRGDCFDNAVAESFFATLKKELIRREAPFPTRADLRLALFDYIETLLQPNQEALHARLPLADRVREDQSLSIRRELENRGHSRSSSTGSCRAWRAADWRHSSASARRSASTAPASSPPSAWASTKGRTEALNNKVRLIVRRAYGFHSAAALALVMLTCGPITLRLPHQVHEISSP